jgi:parallel beta-helix repeat protein
MYFEGYYLYTLSCIDICNNWEGVYKVNKYIIPIMVILLLLSSFTGVSSTIIKMPPNVSLDGNILYVGGDGFGNYSKIQDAIDNATNGDTIFVFNDSSPYYENLVVDKSINLFGEDRNSTTIDGNVTDSVIEVYADHVSIEGFTVTNCLKDLSDAGINIFSECNTIKNNNIMENQCTGIRLSSSEFNLIENNIFKDNVLFHINLRDESDNNTIKNNNLTASNDWPYACDGISLIESSDNLIINNKITGLIFTIGIGLGTKSNYNVVNKNRIYNNPCDDEANNIQISDHSHFNLIIDNKIKSNNGSGIVMFFSQGNEIIGNLIEFLPSHGIFLGDCRYNNIVRFNNVSYTDRGIRLAIYSSKNFIESNNLTRNTYGIYLSGTDLLGFTPNNVISGNNIVENNYGIYITVSSLYGYSNDSLICYNNLINNTQNAYDECNNSWDDGKYGNYWSDYVEKYPDAKMKPFRGIWDTPYDMSGGDNGDSCPLINQWPKSSSTYNPRISTSFNSLFHWLLEQFPILSRLFHLIK